MSIFAFPIGARCAGERPTSSLPSGSTIPVPYSVSRALQGVPPGPAAAVSPSSAWSLGFLLNRSVLP